MAGLASVESWVVLPPGSPAPLSPLILLSRAAEGNIARLKEQIVHQVESSFLCILQYKVFLNEYGGGGRTS